MPRFADDRWSRVTIKNEGQVRGLGFISGLVSKSQKIFHLGIYRIDSEGQY